jgi:hypothetical protein
MTNTKTNNKSLGTIFMFLIIFLCNQPVIAQDDFSSAGLLYNNNGIKIELFIRLSNNPCGVNAKKSKFQLKLTNVSENLYRLPNYLNWKMDIVNCNNDVITKTNSIDFQTYNTDGINKSLDWEFEGDHVDQPFYEVSLSQTPDYARDKVKAKSKPIAADSISGNKDLLPGQETILTVKGGLLTPDASWLWYANSCNGTLVGKGISIRVKPTITTKYFVQAVSTKHATDCISTSVIVDDNSKPAQKISGNNKFCDGSTYKEKLVVIGGKLGVKAKWIWREGSCDASTIIGEGTEIFISPQKTTTYFVRAEGTTNKTKCVEFRVEVVNNSEKAQRIHPVEVVCQGEDVLLNLEGGKLASDAKWIWYSQALGSISKITIGEGVFIKYIPTSSTSHIFVRAEGYCNKTDEESILVNVKQNSISPSIIQKTVSASGKKSYELNVVGGKLGENAKWVWRDKNCEGKVLGTGEKIKYRASKQNKIFVRAEGDCNKTSCASTEFTHKAYQKKYRFINAGIVSNDLTLYPKFMISAGTQTIYFRVKLGLISSEKQAFKSTSLECDEVKILNYPTNTNTYYKFNGEVLSDRNSFTVGIKFGGDPLRFYLGGGYGTYSTIWGIDEYSTTNNTKNSTGKWAKNITQNISGPELGAGIFLKLKSFNIMGGLSAIYSPSNKKQFIDSHFGIGFSF